MPRPTILVATANPTMAYALSKRLTNPCRDLGLKLEICPDGGICEESLGVKAYESAADFFDTLDARSPMDLADTMVVLDVGTELKEAFEPAVKQREEGWYVAKGRRAGMAVELILRFPQVFPVFLSPSVPTGPEISPGECFEIIDPEPLESIEGWTKFRNLEQSLRTAHIGKNSSGETTSSKIEFFDALMPFCRPLHFVSPLDEGKGLYSIFARFSRGMRCWFDPTGLRTLVKNRFLGVLFGSKDKWNEEPSRDVLRKRLDHAAIAIDEERELAMLNAYTAYKFGRRAWMVITFAEFNDKPLWVFKTVPNNAQVDVVVLRDIDLRFPDIPDEPSEQGGKMIDPVREQLKLIDSDIWRLNALNARLGPQWRVRCVSSHRNVKKVKNDSPDLGQEPIKATKLDDVTYFGLAKPIATLYALTPLLDKSGECNSVVSQLSPANEESVGGHGAPYLNLAMAESLLRQGGLCQNGPVENLVGALLAGEAYELLLGMSKTTALEALMMLHKKEVAAEVGFPGVSDNIKISPRIKDVEKSLESLFEQETISDPKNADKTKNLFLSRFWSDLRPVYRDAEQFEPAEAANRESLIYAQWIPGYPSSKLTLRAKKLLVNISTRFRWMFLAALIMWTVVTSLYFYLNGEYIELGCNGVVNYAKLYTEVVLTSLALQPTEVLTPIVTSCKWLLLVHVSFSYLMFGLLVSILHRKITRG